jgi:hypothetical protein
MHQAATATSEEKNLLRFQSMHAQLQLHIRKSVHGEEEERKRAKVEARGTARDTEEQHDN